MTLNSITLNFQWNSRGAISQISNATTAKWIKIGQYCQRQRCKHVKLEQSLAGFFVAQISQRQLGFLVIIYHKLKVLVTLTLLKYHSSKTSRVDVFYDITSDDQRCSHEFLFHECHECSLSPSHTSPPSPFPSVRLISTLPPFPFDPPLPLLTPTFRSPSLPSLPLS